MSAALICPLCKAMMEITEAHSDGVTFAELPSVGCVCGFFFKEKRNPRTGRVGESGWDTYKRECEDAERTITKLFAAL